MTGFELVSENVTAAFGDRVVLESLNHSFRSGQSTALVGASGSGKTTFLSILGGLSKPTSGHVSIVDQQGDQHPLESAISWVLQTTNALGRRTVLENAMLGLLLDSRGETERRALAKEMLSVVGLGHVMQAPARSLSGGEAQRLSVARALVADRPFVLADEPTGQLDRKSTITVLEALFHEPSRGLIIATHDPIVWERCDQTIVMT